VLTGIFQWLTDPANWSGPGGIPTRILEHLGYAAVSLLISAAIAIPLGIAVGHSGRAKWAVPSLGLLFAVALWLGPKIANNLAYVIPSVIVLVLLAVPPILSGTYAGIEGVDPAARDAAKGMGMRGSEVLRRVEIPCALPLMLSGLRSATLQVIATATIAASISLGGLGRFLIDGLSVSDYAQMAGGAILVALLALVIDGLLSLVQRAVVSPGLTGKFRDNRPVVSTDRARRRHRSGHPVARRVRRQLRPDDTGRRRWSGHRRRRRFHEPHGGVRRLLRVAGARRGVCRRPEGQGHQRHHQAQHRQP
jgi:osmoprotectant transport system permease protein